MTRATPEAESGRSIVGLCLVIARAGCLDSLAWWEDNSLTEAGLFSLKRLFPRTYERAAIRLAMQAARTRHEGVLRVAGITDGSHLYSLLNPEAMIEGPSELDSLRSDLWSPIPDRNILQRRLEAMAGPLPRLPVGVNVGLQGLIDLSDILPKSVAAKGQVAMNLAAAYLLGDQGKPVVPYVRSLD